MDSCTQGVLGSRQRFQSPPTLPIYCSQVTNQFLARGLGIDVPGAVEEKLRKNKEKYPAELVRGSARKYTEY